MAIWLMSDTKDKILLVGIGNYGRQDDGLGWCFLDEVQNRLGDKFDYDYKYQLNIEDAAQIAEVSKIIFVDAFAKDLENGFQVQRCEMQDTYEFTTHALNPGVIISLCKKLYNAEPDAFVITIQGVNWELSEGLSKNADHNLKKAVEYFINNIDQFEYTESYLKQLA